MCKEQGCKGIYIDENAPNIIMLLFADDMVFCSDIVARLQKGLNLLEEYSVKWGLKVNLSKTKVMVFRRGGTLKKSEVWYYDGVKLDTTSAYKYLGLIFTPKGSWFTATKTLASQASKAVAILNKILWKCGDIPFNAAFELFDKMILPILTYGSEVWGFTVYDNIEMVQRKFCRQYLKVSSTTSNVAVLGECGRHPLYIFYMTRCIKYWLKVLQMENTRYPNACYKMLKRLDDLGRPLKLDLC